jgi:hypothetical protein
MDFQNVRKVEMNDRDSPIVKLSIGFCSKSRTCPDYDFVVHTKIQGKMLEKYKKKAY